MQGDRQDRRLSDHRRDQEPHRQGGEMRDVRCGQMQRRRARRDQRVHEVGAAVRGAGGQPFPDQVTDDGCRWSFKSTRFFTLKNMTK